MWLANCSSSHGIGKWASRCFRVFAWSRSGNKLNLDFRLISEIRWCCHYCYIYIYSSTPSFIYCYYFPQDVNVQNDEKNTPLHWAALNGQVKVSIVWSKVIPYFCTIDCHFFPELGGDVILGVWGIDCKRSWCKCFESVMWIWSWLK